MKSPRFLFILTALNCMLLVFLVAQMRPVEANNGTGVLPEVKMGASVKGAGFSLVGEFDTTQILLDAQGGETLLKMTNADGRREVITP